MTDGRANLAAGQRIHKIKMRLSKRKIWLLVVASATIIGALAVVFGTRVINETFRKDYDLFGAVKVGMADEEVTNLLGNPYKIYYKGTAPTNYYVEGYTYKKRDIPNKVFIYIGAEPIAYIYFDSQNKVEDVFVGGS